MIRSIDVVLFRTFGKTTLLSTIETHEEFIDPIRTGLLPT